MPIKIQPSRHPDGDSFKLNLSGDASIQEYLDNLNEYYVNGALTRLWPDNQGFCEGCHYCCHEPAPVTLQDVYRLMDGLQVDWLEVFKYLWVEEQDGAVDITLRRKSGDACVFLRPDGRCSIYDYRPLVCQSYICCPQDKDHEDLRSAIVNQGEDALIRQAILQFKSQGLALPVNRGNSRRIRLADWPPNKMSHAENYQQIRLKDILPARLYKKLQCS